MSTKAAAGKSETRPDEIILHVPLSDIFVDYDWNVRRKSNVMANESDAVQDTTLKSEHQMLGGGLRGLMTTIRNNGQETATVLRRVDGNKSLGGKKTDRPFELVCGFRRYTAIEKLQTSKEDLDFAKANNQPNIVPNTANGTILAVVRTLTPLQARMLNASENTDRQNLDTQDMLGLVTELLKAKLSQTAIADGLNITQGYVSKLAKISKLPKAVLDHWKGEAKLPGLPENVQTKLRTNDLIDLYDVCSKDNMTDGQVTKRYAEILNPPAGTGASASNKDPVADRVIKAATVAGDLVKAGVLLPGDMQWAKVIGPKGDGYSIDTGKIDAAKRGHYWDLAQRTFLEASKATEQAASDSGESASVEG